MEVNQEAVATPTPETSTDVSTEIATAAASPPVIHKNTPKRTKGQRERDLALLARLYVRKWSLDQIAKRLKVSVSQVRYDLKEVRQKWEEEQLYSYNARKAEELVKIDNLERLAHRGYERSCQEQTRSRTEQTTTDTPVAGVNGKNVKKASLQKQQRDGNPAFLDRIAWCIDKRCQILGLDAPKKFAPTTPDGTQPYGSRPLEELTDAELFELIVKSARDDGAGTTLEASFSAPEPDRLCDVYPAELSGELAPQGTSLIPGQVGPPGDQEAPGLDAASPR